MAETYFSIALSILEQIQNELGRLHRPAPLAIGMPVLGLSCTPNTTAETSERNGLLVNQNILQISLCLNQGHLPDRERGLPCVLSKKIGRYKE